MATSTGRWGRRGLMDQSPAGDGRRGVAPAGNATQCVSVCHAVYVSATVRHIPELVYLVDVSALSGTFRTLHGVYV